MTGSQIRAGRKLGGRYTLLTLIARGGMGEVWKARDSVTGTLVAAKVLRPELTGEEVSLSRLRLEARNAMSAKHPNIASVLDSGEEDSQGWLIMEMVEGDPLTEFIGDGRTLTPAQLIPLLIQTSYALDAAARADVVHRDIKPANILVRPDGKVKLTDFGVSLAGGQANLTAAGMVMGTAQYLPPEQALGKQATPVGDLYALGVIAFEALAGHRPYTGESQVDIAFAHVNQDIPELPEHVPAPLAALVTQLMAKDPERRPATGAALARELTNVAEQLKLDTSPVPLRTSPPAPAAPAPKVEGEPAATNSAEAVPAPVVAPVRHVRKQWLPITGEPVSHAQSSPPASTAPVPIRTGSPHKQVDWGMWIIVGLTVLTVVLILVAMVRNYDLLPAATAAVGTHIQELQEVQTWLTPPLGA